MHGFTTVNHVLSELGRRNSIAGLRLSAESTIGLCLKDGVEVDFEYDSQRNRLYLYTAILPLPKDTAARLKLCEAMLELNCLEKGIPCGSLSIHRQHEAAICQLSLAVDGLTAPPLEKALRELLLCRNSMATALGRILNGQAEVKPAADKPNKASASLLAMRIPLRK